MTYISNSMPFLAPNCRFRPSYKVQKHDKKPGFPGFFVADPSDPSNDILVSRAPSRVLMSAR